MGKGNKIKLKECKRKEIIKSRMNEIKIKHKIEKINKARNWFIENRNEKPHRM